jgi:membrane-associated phospholipid phosphatase
VRREWFVRVTVLIVALSLAGSPPVTGADDTSRAGDVTAVLIPAAAATGAIALKDHEGLRQLTEVFAASLAVVYVLKYSVNRTRPDGGHHSFPSGHAASAFAGAAFLQRRYGWKIGVPASLAAVFVGYSRVESHRHYTSDVVAGAAISIGATLLFTHPRSHVTPLLDVSHDHVAVSIALAW